MPEYAVTTSSSGMAAGVRQVPPLTPGDEATFGLLGNASVAGGDDEVDRRTLKGAYAPDGVLRLDITRRFAVVLVLDGGDQAGFFDCLSGDDLSTTQNVRDGRVAVRQDEIDGRTIADPWYVFSLDDRRVAVARG